MLLSIFKEKNIIVAVLMSSAIFMIDILAPLWYDAWVLYLIPMFFMFQSAKRPYIFSVIVTLLTVAGLFFSTSDSTTLLHASANRITGILGGWGVSFLLMRLRHLNDSLLRAGNELEKRVEDRTAELSQANRSLQKENEERIRVEKALRQSEEQIRHSLKEKEILLKEIHHRVKNNLAVVSSLLALQSRQLKDKTLKAMLEDSQQRIRAMALVHEKLLYQTTDFSQIDFRDYINTIVKELLSTFNTGGKDITTKIDIEDIKLDLEHAIPYGLMINELLTNSLKYAFPGDRGGQIAVTFTKSDDIFTLTIKDNGIGLPEGFDYTQAHTLGLQLINILASQLKGTLQMNSEGGTEAVITVRSRE